MEEIYTQVADMIWERGAFKIDIVEGFELRLHQDNPEAPKSPFYINLRTKDNRGKKGELTHDDCDLIAQCLWEKLSELVFEAIAGIPHAAEPFVQALEAEYPGIGFFRYIKLDKKDEGGKREIIPKKGFSYQEHEVVVVVDDLVTKADSKIEAIRSIEKQGSVVNDLVVLIDRGQGGQEMLKKEGYNLVSCFTVKELFSYYKRTGKIDWREHKKCMDYVDKN